MSESTRSRDEWVSRDMDDLPPLLLISPIRSQSLGSCESSSSESEDEDSESSVSLSDSSDLSSSIMRALAPAFLPHDFSAKVELFSTSGKFS